MFLQHASASEEEGKTSSRTNAASIEWWGTQLGAKSALQCFSGWFRAVRESWNLEGMPNTNALQRLMLIKSGRIGCAEAGLDDSDVELCAGCEIRVQAHFGRRSRGYRNRNNPTSFAAFEISMVSYPSMLAKKYLDSWNDGKKRQILHSQVRSHSEFLASDHPCMQVLLLPRQSHHPSA